MTWHPILRGFSQLGRETRGVRENQFNPLSVCQCLCIAPIELRLISSIHPLPDSPLGNSVKTCAICQPFTTLVIICAPFLINDLHRRLFHHCSRFLAIALRSPLLVVSSNREPYIFLHQGWDEILLSVIRFRVLRRYHLAWRLAKGKSIRGSFGFEVNTASAGTV